MKKYVIHTAIWSLLSLFLCACQPTPGNQIVDDKGGNIIENIQSNNQNEEASLTSFPDKWKVSLEEANLSVSIDANIIVASSGVISLVSVMPDPFSVEDIQLIIDTAFPDTQLYDGMQEYQWTKQDIQDEIVKMQMEINDTDSQLLDYKEADREAYINELEDYIDYLEGMYTTAPEESNIEPIVLTQELAGEGAFIKLRKKDSPDIVGSIMIGSTDMENGKAAELILNFPSTDILSQSAEPKELTISEDEAVKAANDMLQKLNIQDMQINRVLLTETPSGERYRLIYTKEYSDLPETYVYQEQTENEHMTDADYDFNWTGECILMDVDNEGVKIIDWTSPTKIKEDLNSSIQLLTFEDIQKSFIKQLGYQEMWMDSESGIVGRKIVIDEIRLGMMKVKVQGNSEEYVMIPVWDFFGYSIDKYKEQLPGGYQLDENMEHTNTELQSFITINANDGSIIDRNLGY